MPSLLKRFMPAVSRLSFVGLFALVLLMTNAQFVSATSMTATSPAGSGTVDITVTTPSGTSATGAADQFVYAAAVPTMGEWFTIALGALLGGIGYLGLRRRRVLAPPRI